MPAVTRATRSGPLRRRVPHDGGGLTRLDDAVGLGDEGGGDLVGLGPGQHDGPRPTVGQQLATMAAHCSGVLPGA